MIYSNGVSLIHLAMGIGMSFITWPDPGFAREKEQEYMDTYGAGVYEVTNTFEVGCERFAEDLQFLMVIFIVCHIICGILNIYREIFETKLGVLGQVMRGLELFCIAASLTLIILAVQAWFYYVSIVDNTDVDSLRTCLTDV